MFGSSFSSMKTCILASLVLVGVQTVTSISSGNVIAILCGVLAVVLLLVSFMFSTRVTNSIKEAVSFCRKVENGDFETRIVKLSEKGDLGDLAWALNGLVDRMDAFIREAMASMEYVSHNKFYRRILERGMVGTYLHATQTINGAAGAMETVYLLLRISAEVSQKT